jgi:hypothetical protein
MMSNDHQIELAQKQANLIATIENALPDFAKACRSQDAPIVVLHQDAFAADYQEGEYRLLGMAVKFAGIYGKELHIHGTNRQTVDQNEVVH